VIAFPDIPAFAAAIADPRFVPALLIAILSGLVRGFSGFGSALIYIPLIAAVYEPRVAATTLLLVDFVSGSPFAVREFARSNWREVLPIWLSAAIAVPIGTWALIVVDPIVLRWFISLLVLGLLAVLVSGWRYHGTPRLPVTIGVGLFSGFGGGAVQISGPAVIIYWLSGGGPAATVRANLMVYFVLHGGVMILVYLTQGLFTADVLALALLLGVPFLLAMIIGARLFRGSSDRLYRTIAYVIVAVAALVSVPALDGLLR
jgi:uncharacterized membrane protein YfcA